MRKDLVQLIAQMRNDRDLINKTITDYEAQIVSLNIEKAEKQEIHDTLVGIATQEELTSIEIKVS